MNLRDSKEGFGVKKWKAETVLYSNLKKKKLKEVNEIRKKIQNRCRDPQPSIRWSSENPAEDRGEGCRRQRGQEQHKETHRIKGTHRDSQRLSSTVREPAWD